MDSSTHRYTPYSTFWYLSSLGCRLWSNKRSRTNSFGCTSQEENKTPASGRRTVTRALPPGRRGTILKSVYLFISTAFFLSCLVLSCLFYSSPFLVHWLCACSTYFPFFFFHFFPSEFKIVLVPFFLVCIMWMTTTAESLGNQSSCDNGSLESINPCMD